MAEQRKEITTKDIVGNIYDYSNRWYLMEAIAGKFGVDKEALTILEFIVMGNPDAAASLPDVLKKFKLPVKDGKYDVKKMQRWIDLIVRQMKDMDKTGVLDLDMMTVLRESKNGKYMTMGTVELDYVVYKSVYEILRNNPQYLVKVLLGVYEALGMILRFLGVEEMKAVTLDNVGDDNGAI